MPFRCVRVQRPLVSELVRLITTVTIETSALTSNRKLLQWVEEVAALAEPDAVHWCDGSAEEYDRIAQRLVDAGTFERLSDAKRPNSYLALSDPSDVARVEDRTFICSRREEDAGADQQLARPRRDAQGARGEVPRRDAGPHDVRRPVQHGPAGLLDRRDRRRAHGLGVRRRVHADHDPHGQARPRRARRRRLRALPALGRRAGRRVAWPSNEEKYIVHFPEDAEIWSYGSGYGGNALLGKKCLALRIASAMARDEGWLAEHMLIIKVTFPEGESKYMTARVPERLGQDQPGDAGAAACPGWTVETVGDDIAWMKFGEDGRLYAVNPEAGFFGVAPNTSEADQSQRDGHDPREHDLHQRRAKTDEGDIWWEGMTAKPPRHVTDWQGQDWTPGAGRPAAHPNARFTAPASQCPSIAPEWEDPRGVPIDAFLFGGRRATVVPLVREAFDWDARRLPRRDHERRDHRRRRRRGRSAALRPDGDAPVLRLQHGRLLRALARGRPPRRGQAAADLLRQLVPQGRRREVPVAGLRRQLPRAGVDLPPPRRAARARARRRSATCRGPRTWTRAASTSRPRSSKRCSTSTWTTCARSSGRSARTWHGSAIACPGS